jgi:hypothetical protein
MKFAVKKRWPKTDKKKKLFERGTSEFFFFRASGRDSGKFC